MTKYPWDYKWSSAAFHYGEVASDLLVSSSSSLSNVVTNWREFLSTVSPLTPQLEEKIRTGHPSGPEKFYPIVEGTTGPDTHPRSTWSTQKTITCHQNTHSAFLHHQAG